MRGRCPRPGTARGRCLGSQRAQDNRGSDVTACGQGGFVKIVSLVVRLHCINCDAKGSVRGVQQQYGELVECPVCSGRGTVAGEVAFEDFEKLIRGIAALKWTK